MIDISMRCDPTVLSGRLKVVKELSLLVTTFGALVIDVSCWTSQLASFPPTCFAQLGKASPQGLCEFGISRSRVDAVDGITRTTSTRSAVFAKEKLATFPMAHGACRK